MIGRFPNSPSMVVLQRVSLYVVNMNNWFAEVFELEINSNNQLEQNASN
jgi:hypothetical protein